MHVGLSRPEKGEVQARLIRRREKSRRGSDQSVTIRVRFSRGGGGKKGKSRRLMLVYFFSTGEAYTTLKLFFLINQCLLFPPSDQFINITHASCNEVHFSSKGWVRLIDSFPSIFRVELPIMILDPTKKVLI